MKIWLIEKVNINELQLRLLPVKVMTDLKFIAWS